MIRCPKCDNDTRTSGLVTSQGDVMLTGTIATGPQPILAQVCTACGYIELYAPLQFQQPQVVQDQEAAPASSGMPEVITA